ncbi:hypothetical protein AAVH_27707, partial [Aphelenchoides avenae]
VVSGSNGYSPSDSIDLCAKNDAVLPSITDLIMNYRLMSFVIDAQTSNDYVNIGLSYNATAQKWQWVDGRAASFTYWKLGYPQDVTSGPCAKMTLNAPQTGSWININCDSGQDTAVVCERESGEYE